MSNIQIYKKKIKSSKNIAKITRALQMVSASKMKRAQEMAVAGQPYLSQMDKLSQLFVGKIDNNTHPLMSLPKSENKLIVFIAPEKGLCGSLISNLDKSLSKLLTGNLSEYQFVVVGKKAQQLINKRGGEIIADFSIGFGQPSFDLVPSIVRIITEKYLNGEVGYVSVLYSHFINTMNQEPMSKSILPIVIEDSDTDNISDTSSEYVLFEPNPKDLAKEFFERYIEVEIYQLLLESYASEQSARMIAMKNANDNAKNLISYLSLAFNKARQAAITSEIADISSAQANS